MRIRNYRFSDLVIITTATDGPGEDDVVSESFSCSDSLHLTSPKLWWPYLMSEAPGYMYQLRITVISIKHGMDEYTLPVGLREVTRGDSSFMINHQPFYFS